jgi:hypothetical protein
MAAGPPCRQSRHPGSPPLRLTAASKSPNSRSINVLAGIQIDQRTGEFQIDQRLSRIQIHQRFSRIQIDQRFSRIQIDQRFR